MNILYSVIIPVYNSTPTLAKVVDEVFLVFEMHKQSLEMVLIDDGSADTSWEIINQLKNKYKDRIKAIRLSKNFGQHQAIYCGLKFASGNYIVTIDDDGQNPPSEIPKLIDNITTTKADLVYGVYQQKQHHFFRNWSSNMVQIVFRSIFKNKGNVTAFRCIKKNLIDKITSSTQSQVYLDGLLHWHTSNVNYVLVEHHKRLAGQSGYSAFKLIKLAANLVFNFTTLPLRFLVLFGGISSVISFILGVYYIIRRFIWDDAPMGFTPLMVSIFFLASAIMFGFGVIAEYLRRIYGNQNNEPAYSIDILLE